MEKKEKTKERSGEGWRRGNAEERNKKRKRGLKKKI